MATVALIFILLCVLIAKLVEVQRAAERTVVDMEVATLRTVLQLVIASRIVRGEDVGLVDWVGRNPLALASGETAAVPAAGQFSLSGPWRWDAEAAALVHDFRDGGCLQLRLAKVRPGLADGWLLGGGLLLVLQKIENNC